MKANHIIPLIKTQWGAQAVPDTQEAEAGRLFELKNSKSAWVTLKKTKSQLGVGGASL